MGSPGFLPPSRFSAPVTPGRPERKACHEKLTPPVVHFSDDSQDVTPLPPDPGVNKTKARLEKLEPVDHNPPKIPVNAVRNVSTPPRIRPTRP